MVALNPAQVIGDLAFQHGVDRLAEIVPKQHIFRRDGAVGFQFEHPVPVRLPEAKQCARRRGDAGLQGAGFTPPVSTPTVFVTECILRSLYLPLSGRSETAR